MRANQKRSPGPLVGRFRSQRSATPGEGCGGAPRMPAAPLMHARAMPLLSLAGARPACAARTSVALGARTVTHHRPKQLPRDALYVGAIANERRPPPAGPRAPVVIVAVVQHVMPVIRPPPGQLANPVTAIMRARPGNQPRLLGLRVAVHPVDCLIRVVDGDLTHDPILPERGRTSGPRQTSLRRPPPRRVARPDGCRTSGPRQTSLRRGGVTGAEEPGKAVAPLAHVRRRCDGLAFAAVVTCDDPGVCEHRVAPMPAGSNPRSAG